MEQPALWAKITAIQVEVRNALGPDLPADFRTSNVYLTYAGTCGQAHYAYEDGELDEALLAVLAECAEQVKAAWAERGKGNEGKRGK